MKERLWIDGSGWIRLVCLGLALMTRAASFSTCEVVQTGLAASLTGLLCIAGSGLSGKKRFLPLACLILFLIPSHTPVCIAAGTVCAAAAGMRTLRNAWSATWDSTEKELYRGGILYALSCISSFFRDADWTLSACFFLLFLSISFFLLRILRSGRIHDLQQLKLNTAVCIGMSAVMLGICTPAFRTLIREAILLALHYIAMPVLWVLLMGAAFLLMIIFRLVSPLFLLIPGEPFSHVKPVEFPDLSAMLGEEEELQESANNLPAVLRTVLIILVTAGAVWMLMRYLRARRITDASVGTLQRESLGSEGRKKKKARRLTGIRALYARHLTNLHKAGVRMEARDTSDVTAKRCDDLLGTDDGSQMRRYWLPVRFGNKGEEDLPEVREIYRRIRKRQKELKRHS